MKKLFCLACPTGCRLTITGTGADIHIEGYECPDGHNFAITETTEPTRTLTTTVRTKFPGVLALSVRTDGEIPKHKFTKAMHELSKVVVTEELICGDILLEDIAKTGVRVIVTSTALMQLGAELENKNIELQRRSVSAAGFTVTANVSPGIGVVRNSTILDDLGTEAAGGFVGTAGEAVGVEDSTDDESQESMEQVSDDSGYIKPKSRPHIKGR